MSDKIVAVDFSGTITRAFLAEEANIRRCKTLGIAAPDDEEHKKQHGTKSHYQLLKDAIGKRYGLSDEMKVKYVQNYGKEIELSGADMKTIIMTELFKMTNFEIAAEKGDEIFQPGMVEALKRIQDRGFKVAVFSGTREDIITGLFAIAKCELAPDFVIGQDPILSRDDSSKLLEKLAKKGDIVFIIGDKLTDLTPANKLNAKSVFVKWGHPIGGEEEVADFAIEDAEDLDKIIV